MNSRSHLLYRLIYSSQDDVIIIKTKVGN